MKKNLRPKEFPFIVVESGKRLLVLSIIRRIASSSLENAEFHHAVLDIFAKHKINVLRAYKQMFQESLEWVSL